MSTSLTSYFPRTACFAKIWQEKAHKPFLVVMESSFSFLAWPCSLKLRVEQLQLFILTGWVLILLDDAYYHWLFFFLGTQQWQKYINYVDTAGKRKLRGIELFTVADVYGALRKLHPKWKGKKKRMLRKATKVYVYIQCFSLFSKL